MTNVSNLTLSEVYDHLQILEYIATSTHDGLTEGDRKFITALETQKIRLLADGGKA